MEESQIKNIWAHEHDRGPVLSTCTLQCFAIILPPVFTLKITLLSQPCLLGFWWDCLQSVCLHFFPSHSSRSLVCLRVCFLLSSTPLHTFYNNTTISSVAFHSSLSQFLSLQTSLSFSACHIVLLCFAGIASNLPVTLEVTDSYESLKVWNVLNRADLLQCSLCVSSTTAFHVAELKNLYSSARCFGS